MYEFPDELWRLIKDFLIDYKKHHKIKMKPIFNNHIFTTGFRDIYCISNFYSWSEPNIYNNTIWVSSHINLITSYIGVERRPAEWAPDKKKTTICEGTMVVGGWCCSYGWEVPAPRRYTMEEMLKQFL